MATLNNFSQCRQEIKIYENNSPTEIFDIKDRKFIKGQWVDVKDTIDQWLEAQVIDVQEDKVYIHYNGWGNRWDEWIEMNSPRIKAFRYEDFD